MQCGGGGGGGWVLTLVAKDVWRDPGMSLASIRGNRPFPSQRVILGTVQYSTTQPYSHTPALNLVRYNIVQHNTVLYRTHISHTTFLPFHLPTYGYLLLTLPHHPTNLRYACPIPRQSFPDTPTPPTCSSRLSFIRPSGTSRAHA